MADRPLDRIHVRDLLVRTIVGIRDWEREKKQDVVLNITLHADLGAACRSDAIDDTVDYVAIKRRVIDTVEGSSFYLVERLAQAVADVCLADKRVQRVNVLLEKPGALLFARTVAIEITRERGG